MHFVDHPPPTRQRGPHNDPSLLDGDSAHGTSDVVAGDEWAVDTDTDVVDEAPADPLEEVVDEHTPDAEAERNEEESDEGDVFDTVDDAEADEDDADDGEGELVADEWTAADEGELADADIDAEGDAREPEPDETTLEVELNRQAHREPAQAANPARATRGEPVVPPPLEGYERLTIPQVLERMAGMDAVQVAAVLEFERANKNRKTLVTKLSKMVNGAT